MIRVKEIDRSPRRLPVLLDEQLIPGTLPHAIDEMVDLLNPSCFEVHYRNEKRGARAYPPSVLLTIILLATRDLSPVNNPSLRTGLSNLG